MPGKVGFRVCADWRRADPAVLAAFTGAASSQVADSMNRLGGMDSGIKPVWPAPRVIGCAVTVWCHSADNLMIHKALSMSKPGDILVINTQGSLNNSGLGELIATSAIKVGIKAAIVDGTVRDADALQALRFPVYSRGTSPNGCNKDGGGEVGTTIACGGVAVGPGDIIIADRDGVVVVPLADAAEVARLAAAKVTQEKNRMAEIAEGIVVRPEIDEQLRRLKIID